MLTTTITGREYITPPPALVAMLRATPLHNDDMTKVGGDMWVTYRPVSPHSDSTEDGLVTYGCVLINDADYGLIHGGLTFDIPAGTLYRFDGRVTHEACAFDGKHGLFAALIWDMPPAWDLIDFNGELLRDARFQ